LELGVAGRIGSVEGFIACNIRRSENMLGTAEKPEGNGEAYCRQDGYQEAVAGCEKRR
jgi:hypothetical protein